MRTCKRPFPHDSGALGLVVLFLAVSLSASVQESVGLQATANVPPPRMQIQSNLVVIRVVVGDAQGHPVSGLRKEDFQVLDQGKKQSIAQFDEAAPSEPTAQTLATGSPQTAVPPATRAAERYIALYFDNLNSTSADLIAARDAADRLFGSKLPAGDHVAVFTSDELLYDFTDDPNKIHDALFRLHVALRHPLRCTNAPTLQSRRQLKSPSRQIWMAMHGVWRGLNPRHARFAPSLLRKTRIVPGPIRHRSRRFELWRIGFSNALDRWPL